MSNTESSNRGLSRRQFMQAALAGGAASLLTGRMAFALEEAASAPARTPVWIFHGQDKSALMKACMKTIAENGGLGDGARKLTLKVNGAWIRTPAQGANTHPELVDAFLKGCKDQGIAEVVLPEHACAKATESFVKSGLLDATKANGARMIDLQREKSLFKDVELPGGQNLKSARVAADFLETDVLVNMPVAKHHSGASMTCALKNWMGAVEDRNFWHRNNLHQCIADIGTLLRPRWTLVDATRIMLARGPQGPTDEMNRADLLILSRDQVAADAYTASLFPEDIQERIHYLRIAREMKLGAAEMSQLDVRKIEVA